MWARRARARRGAVAVACVACVLPGGPGEARAQDGPIEVPGIVRNAGPDLRRFTPAPTPKVDPRFDGARLAGKRDAVTGAMTGSFGGAYTDASPLPVLDVGRRDPTLPAWFTGSR